MITRTGSYEQGRQQFIGTDQEWEEAESQCEMCLGTGKIEVDYGDGDVRVEKCECQLEY